MVRIIEVGNACITIWDGEPTIEDVDATYEAAKKMYDRTRNQIVLFGILSPTVKVPSETVRAKMLQNWPLLMPLASTMQYVTLATGFTAARLISLVVSVFALSKHGRTVNVHSKLDPAVEDALRIEPSLRAIEVKRVINSTLREIQRTAGV